MKIGIVSEFYYPLLGGVSEHIRSVARELKELGHEVVVISGHMKGEQRNPGPRVIRLGRSLTVPYNNSLSRVSAGWRLGAKLEALLEVEKFDLLHLHSPLQPTLTHLAMRRAKCPLVGTFHSYYPRDMLSEIFKRPLGRMLNRIDRYLPVSQAAQEPMERIFHADYQIIPNGVDFDLFAGEAVGGRRQLPGLDPDKLRILFVGAMVKRKGLPHLIEAFREILRSRDDVELLVVGDGPGRRAIDRGLDVHLRSRIHFVGAVSSRSKLAEYYASADIFCAPSLGRESFGMVLLEAMAAGLPVVAYDIEGYRDVVTQGSDGLLVQRGNTAALADALRFFLESPDERARYGERGRVVAENLDWSEIARRVEAVYLDMLGMPARELPVAKGVGAGV
jgi:phosphatidyl-myo-inositol alpha-mannosyltransferase